MNPINNNEKVLTERDLMFSLPSAMIGVSILSLPSDIAKVTSFSDGWISIVIAGVIFTLLATMAVKIALHFPDQSFYDFASYLVTRPVAIIISLVFVATGVLISASATRSLAFIAQMYLFERTPMPVIALAFLLVVVYAVSGSRVGIFRLNILFLPIILFVFLFVGLFNIPWIEPVNYLPLFKTDFQGYVEGVLNTIPAYNGFIIGIFYVFLIKQSNNLTKKTIIGINISTVFYLFIFLLGIGIFGNLVTGNLMYPTLDIAKKVDLPGAVFERVDAFVYTIWIMAIFNTVCLFWDASVLLLNSIFNKAKKQSIVFTLSPIIFFIALLPLKMYQLNEIVSVISKFSVAFSLFIIVSFYVLIKILWRNEYEQL